MSLDFQGSPSKRQAKLLGAKHLSDGFFLQTFATPLVVIAERNLRVAPGVEVADLVDALDGTGGGAPFFGVILAVHIGVGVFEKRNTRRASLLRTPVDHAEFIDVEIT